MRALLVLFLLAVGRTWAAFGYYQVVTTTSNATLLPSSQSNLAALLYISDPNFKVAGSGGNVQNVNGYDICLYTDATRTTAIPSKIWRYKGSTGELWTRVSPAVLSLGLTFYVFYGDAGVSTCGQDALNTSYKGFLSFGDGATPSVTDLTGTLSTANSGGTAVTGQVDGGIAFGNPKFAAITTNVALDTIPGTWSFWVNHTSATNFVFFLGRTGGSSLNGINIYNDASGKVNVQIKNGSSAVCNITSSAAVNNGVWRKVDLTFTASGGTTTLYIDGSAASGGTCTVSSAWSFGANDLRLAQSLDSFWGLYPGKLDEFSVANVARSADYVTAAYQNELAPGTFFTLGGQQVNGGGGAVKVRHEVRQ